MADVLFVCVHNAGRSQMAKALFNQAATRLGLSLCADSAGTEIGSHVHPEVVEVMRELGLDVSNERPKVITNEMAQQAKKVVTMGCQVDAGVCPAVFIKGVEDWGLPDPKNQPVEQVRAIRDTIRRKVDELLASMAQSPKVTRH